MKLYVIPAVLIVIFLALYISSNILSCSDCKNYSSSFNISDSDIINCSNGCINYLIGTYTVLSNIDSLNFDEVEIRKDSSLILYDYIGKSTWVIIDKGKVIITPKNVSFEIYSELDFLNGELYICDNIALLPKSGIRLLKK